MEMFHGVIDRPPVLCRPHECPAYSNRTHGIQLVRIGKYPGFRSTRRFLRSEAVGADCVGNRGDKIFIVPDGSKEPLRNLRSFSFMGNPFLLFDRTPDIMEKCSREQDPHVRMFVGPDRLTEAGDPFNMVETMRTALTKNAFYILV